LDEGTAHRHPIGVVAERTGLTPEVIRVWERRYGAVRPERTPAGQRLYTDADVERLRLLRRATQGGRSISSVASLGEVELARLVRADDEAGALLTEGGGSGLAGALDVEAALAYAKALDAVSLESLLRRSVAVHGTPPFLEHGVAPLMRRIGDEWHGGRMSPAQEHLATAVVERVLSSVLSTLAEPSDGPVLVVATPAGERHEVGALLAAAAAAAEGWRVVYLGPDLPADAIAEAAIDAGADAVGLSVVLVESPLRTIEELNEVRRLLPVSVPLLVGGAAASVVAGERGAADAIPLHDLDGMRAALRRLHG
jgi:MerR family transcriptional regulator, light-induced transcriptional regulator